MDEIEAIRKLAAEWCETKKWAENLLIQHLGLDNIADLNHSDKRGHHRIDNTEWWYRTHGVGVDVFKEGNKGGIDFDFDKPDPDVDRLRWYMIKQYNDGKLVKRHYRALLQDEDHWRASYAKAMNIMQNKKVEKSA